MILILFQLTKSHPIEENCTKDKIKRGVNLFSTFGRIENESKNLFSKILTLNDQEFVEKCEKFFRNTDQSFQKLKKCYNEDRDSFSLLEEHQENNKKVSFICRFDLEIRERKFWMVWSPFSGLNFFIFSVVFSNETKFKKMTQREVKSCLNSARDLCEWVANSVEFKFYALNYLIDFQGLWSHVFLGMHGPNHENLQWNGRGKICEKSFRHNFKFF